MRKWFASLAVLGIATAAASAQTVPVPPIFDTLAGESQSIYFDDGFAETSWKVSYPTQAGDSFNVDFDDMAGNMNVIGVAMSTWEKKGGAGPNPAGIRYISLNQDDLTVDATGHTPDINNPLSIVGSLSGTVPVTTPMQAPGAGYCHGTFSSAGGAIGFDMPDVVVPTSGGLHACMSFLTGDTDTWLCSDQSGTGLPKSANNRSYFTGNQYSSPAISFSAHLIMRVVGSPIPPNNGTGTYTVNNATGTIPISQTGEVDGTFWSSSVIQPSLYIQGAIITSSTFIQVPDIILSTGFINISSPISDPNHGTLGDVLSDPSAGPCVPAGFSFQLGAFYLDNMDLKKNGHRKAKATNFVTVVVTPDPKCNPCLCYGEIDDGSAESYWKVAYPELANDWFSVHMGPFIDPNTAAPCGSTITAIEAMNEDTCGASGPGYPTGPVFARTGVYPSNTVVDPTGNTPDVANPISESTGLSMQASSFDFAYGTNVYDIPDVNSTTIGTADTHVAMQFQPGDTCSWIALDFFTGANPAPCPGRGFPDTTSFFTVNGFTSPALDNGVDSWSLCEKIDWN